MSDIIGEASVRITGDITPLQEAVKKVEQVVAPLKDKQLEGFKINYDEQSFESMEQYTKYIREQQAEWEQYVQQQQEVATAVSQTSSSVDTLNESIKTTTSEASQNTSALGNLADSARNFGDAIEGSFLRTRDSIKETDRVGRTALIALGASFTMLAKSSLKEYAKYNEEAAQAQEHLDKSISRVKASLGSILMPVLQVVGGLADWASRNQQIVAGVTTVIGVLAGSAGLIALITKLTSAVRNLKLAAGGIIGILSVVAGLVVGMITEQQSYNETLDETNQKIQDQANNTKQLADGYATMTNSIADAEKQMAEAFDNYRQSLKEILVRHEETVTKLNEQIQTANKDYKKAVDERNANFLVSQAKEEKAHQEKVEELMAQLNFLQRYNNEYNREKLEAVKFAIAREEVLYKKQTEALKAELDLQNEYDRQKRDEKIAAYEQELQTERAFLQKHAELFASVRDVMLRDEVENLQRSYNQTVEGLNKISAQARNTFNQLQNDIQRKTDEMNGYLEVSFNGTIQRIATSYKNNLSAAFDYIESRSTTTGNRVVQQVVSANALAEIMHNLGMPGYATGGYTGQGDENEVAGIVHRGEYVLPQEYVDQSTGTPKNIGGNITVNVSGTFATSESERRKVAQQIVEAIKQTTYARLGA